MPIYRSDKKSDVWNYRGIAIIASIPKPFEPIINKNVFSRINHRITNVQYDFLTGRSTTTNHLEFVNYTLNAMEKGNYVESLSQRRELAMILFFNDIVSHRIDWGKG